VIECLPSKPSKYEDQSSSPSTTPRKTNNNKNFVRRDKDTSILQTSKGVGRLVNNRHQFKLKILKVLS
jgi:hypothetical protein